MTGANVNPQPASDCRLTLAFVMLNPFFLNFFFFLPSTFCASGQFLLVGSSTCPPCPDFSLKLQTSITFDPYFQKMCFFFLPTKLTARHMSTKCFKKSKNSLCSSDADQNRFIRRTDNESFRG